MCSLRKTHEQHQKYPYSNSKKINEPTPSFSPSLRLKEPQTKLTSLIPPEQHLSLHVHGARRTPKIFLYDWRGTATITTASTPRATRRRGVRYTRGPRRTLCSHDRQRAPRKLSVHAVVLCASAFLALKLSRSQRLLQGAGAVHSQHLSLHVDGARRTPKIFLYDLRGTATITTASTPRATRRRGVRYARGTRRTLCSHDCQRAPHKLSVHAVVLSASCSPLYCPGASRPRQACSLFTSRFRVASY